MRIVRRFRGKILPTSILAFLGPLVFVLILSTASPLGGAVPSALALTSSITTVSAPTPSSAGWPTYLGHDNRTSDSYVEKILSVASASKMKLLWEYKASKAVFTAPAVVGGTVFFGSWNGDEYAMNAETGVMEWSLFLGTSYGCNQTQGISSSATVMDNTVYVGGGNQDWYALNAATGNILWKVYVSNTARGFYNWASPLIYNGMAYVGLASMCNTPSVAGALLEIDLTTHKVIHRFDTTNYGVPGASIWGSPMVDAATNTVYAATGSPLASYEPTYNETLLAFNATTLKLESFWQVPKSQAVFDGDFGTTPTLIQVGHRTMVEAANKNGYFYTFDASDLSKGPVWEYNTHSKNDIAPASLGGGLLYAGTQRNTYHEVTAKGGLWAVYPANGTVAWQHQFVGGILGAAAYANGILAVGAGHSFNVLNAKTGKVLKSWSCNGNFDSAPAISHGVIYVGCASGYFYAIGIQSEGAGPSPSMASHPLLPPSDWVPARRAEVVPSLT